MSDILDKVREKYPAYETISDDDLTFALASKYPSYLKADKDFDADFTRITNQRRGAAVDASLDSFRQMHPGLMAPEGGRDIAAIKEVPPDTQDSLAPALPTAPTLAAPEPKLSIPELRQFQPTPNNLQSILESNARAGGPVGEVFQPPPDLGDLSLANRERAPRTPAEFFQVPTEFPTPKMTDLEGQLLVAGANPFNTPRLNRQAGKLVAGAERFGGGIADFVTSPGGFATALTGQIAAAAGAIGKGASAIYGEALQAGEGGERARLLAELTQNVGRTGRVMNSAMSKAFAADMGRHLPELTQDVLEKLKKGDTAGATEGILNGLLTLAAVTGTAYHTQLGRTHAAQERFIKEGGIPEHPGIETQRLSAEASRRNRAQQRPQQQAENVPQVTDDEYAAAERQAIAEAESQGSPVKVVENFSDAGDETTPFNNRFIARAFKHGIEINRPTFRKWLAETPPERRQEAIKSLISEEHIHRHITDADAAAYWDTLTGLEKKAEIYQYTNHLSLDAANKRFGMNLSDLDLGHEAVRRRLQKLYGATPTEIAESALRERWTLKTVDAMSTLLRNVREGFGTRFKTEAAARGLEIINRAQGNLDAARSVLVAKQTADEQGLTLDTTAQSGGVKFEGVPPELRAKMEAQLPKQWAFTDPKTGLTFYTREGATPEEIRDAWKSKQSAPGALRRKYSDKELKDSDPANGLEAPILSAGQKQWLEENAGTVLKDFNSDDAHIQIVSTLRGLRAIASRPTSKGSPEELLGVAYTHHTPSGDILNGNFSNKSFSEPHRDLAVQAARELLQVYKNGIPESAEQSFPGALRRKRPDIMTEGLPLENVPRGSTAERPSATELGAEPVTPQRIAASGYEHLTAETDRVTEAYEKNPDAAIKPPSFDKYVEDMKRRYGDVQPGQLYESFSDNLYKRLFNASGKTLEALQRSIGITVKGRIPDPAKQRAGLQLEQEGASPAARTQIREEAKGTASRQKYRVGAIRIIAEKLLSEAQEASTAKPDRTTVSREDIRFKGTSQQPPFFDISSRDVLDPGVLSQRLTADSRRSNRDPVSLTKRVTALLDKQTGKVYLVSTYPHGRSGAMLVDPSLSQVRNHKPLSQLLARYRPVASMLLDEPVRGFRQSFDSLGDFESKLGTDARRASQSAVEPPLREGETPQPGVFEADVPMTDREAMAVFEHIERESGQFDSPEDVQASLDVLATDIARAKRLGGATPQGFKRGGTVVEETARTAQAGYLKLLNALAKANPGMSYEGLLEKLANNLYENNGRGSEKGSATFVQRTMAQAGAKYSPDVSGETGPQPTDVQGKELTMPIERRPPTDVRPENIPAEEAAKLGTKPAPPVPEGSLKGSKSTPGALRRFIPKSLEDDVMASADAIRYSMSGNVSKDLIARAFDDAQNSPHTQSKETELDVRTAAAVRPGSKVKRAATTWEMGDKKILAGANPLVYSGAVHASGTLDMSTFQNKMTEFQQLVDAGKADAQTMLQSPSWRVRRAGRVKERFGKQLQEELDYAMAHATDPQLVRTALEAQRSRNATFVIGRQNGVNINHKQNFLPGRYDMSADTGAMRNGIWFQQPKIWGLRWQQPKAFDNYYQAFAQPGRVFVAATRDIASLVGHSRRLMLQTIQRDQTIDFVKQMTTPDGLPMAGDAVIAANGKVVPPQGMAGYDIVPVGGKPIAVHPDFSTLVKRLSGVTSAVEEFGPTRALLHFEQFLKHNMLLGDFFHLGRISYYAASIMGSKLGYKGVGYKGGLSALDYSERSLPEAVRKGILTQKQADWGLQQIPYGTESITRRELLRRSQSGGVGFNIGRIQDALYKDVYNNLTPTSGPVRRAIATITDPTSGRYNRFLFDKLTRGLMAESFVSEFERQHKALTHHGIPPDPKALMRDISRDVNNFYGNIGKQGWLKSKTEQDIARLFILAPQWVEGLIKKEAVGASRLTGLSKLTGQRKGLATFGTTGKGIATGLIGAFGLAQAINIITRGQPTWMNKEKGHKLDAYFTFGGEEQGLWFSPFSTFAEITHDIWRLSQTRPTMMDALDQIAGNKESPLTRAAIIARFGHDDYGRKYSTTSGRLKAIGKAIAPVPISFGRLLQYPSHLIAPGTVPPVTRQQVGKQVVASFGIKTEAQETSYQTMKRLADDFNKANQYKPETGWEQVMVADQPSYTALRAQIRNNDLAGAKKTFKDLQAGGRSSEQIVKAMKLWSEHPLTGSKRHESEFIQNLTDDELRVYMKQEEQRMKTYDRFVDWWVDQKDL